MLTTAHHTVEDRGDADYIERFGPFKAESSRSWLGTGYYFWEEDEKAAHIWGKIWYKKFGKDYVICEAELDLTNGLLLDLDNKTHSKFLKDVFERLAGKELTVIGEVIEFLKRVASSDSSKKDIFPFKAIRARDEATPIKNKVPFVKGGKGQLALDPRVIICLVEKNELLLRSFKIIYPEEYVV